MMLESNVWGESSFLFIHTTWIGNDLLKIRKMNSPELILKTAYLSAIALAAILKTRGAFHLVKISGISGSAVNGTRFVGSSHWKIPRKVENLKRGSRFPGWNFRTECRVPFMFLVVCTSSRSTVGHRHVPGFTTKWNNFLPIGFSIFSKWKAPKFDNR